VTRRGLLSGAAAAGLSTGLSTGIPSGEPADWTLLEAARALARRAISSKELTEHCLARIHKYDQTLNTFITLTEESALQEAAACDRRRGGGRLHGIPIALKDNIDTRGVLTTAASRVFRARVPSEDAEIVRRLKFAGAVFLGKLNLDEFAFAGTGTTSAYGPIHNPWNFERITGGSSAGSAAAVAAGLCFASASSDDGGSVRIPASFCGVVGFKTSYGRVSTRGVIPSAYSLDTIGSITRSVEDVAAMLQIIAGYDPNDSITANAPAPDHMAALVRPIRGLRIGIPRDYFFEQLDPDVARLVEAAIGVLRPKVRDVRDVTLPRFQFVKDGSYDVELYHYQKPFFDKSPELYHPWSRQQLESLKSVSAVAYVETLKRLRECRRDIRRVFADVDVLLLPTMREPAPLLSETMSETHVRPPSNVSAFNRFGTPALSLPCGLSRGGMPVGLQVVGRPFDEPNVLAVAYAYQQLSPWREKLDARRKLTYP
jgi:aspartyl-tRNA(Asn)/glutamyl-tRNA(Gln) amidotransferase subunit A